MCQNPCVLCPPCVRRLNKEHEQTQNKDFLHLHSPCWLLNLIIGSDGGLSTSFTGVSLGLMPPLEMKKPPACGGFGLFEEEFDFLFVGVHDLEDNRSRRHTGQVDAG